MSKKTDCLIIIPCYNEENRLEVDEFERGINSFDYSFLFVDDGSTDNTKHVLKKLCQNKTNSNYISLNKNVGKAEAIRQAANSINTSDYNFIGYFDADLATPLSEIPRFIDFAKTIEDPLIIMGSRIKLLGYSKINRKISRHYIGRVFATIVSNMLQLPIYDTQCGAKLISSSAIQTAFRDPFTSKWLFDVEILFRLKGFYNNYENRIIEIPLKKWEDVGGSKIKFSYFLKAPIDLISIYFRYR
jgi:glycosyltransferase involved in cell wall biosynthesis